MQSLLLAEMRRIFADHVQSSQDTQLCELFERAAIRISGTDSREELVLIAIEYPQIFSDEFLDKLK